MSQALAWALLILSGCSTAWAVSMKYAEEQPPGMDPALAPPAGILRLSAGRVLEGCRSTPMRSGPASARQARSGTLLRRAHQPHSFAGILLIVAGIATLACVRLRRNVEVPALLEHVLELRLVAETPGTGGRDPADVASSSWVKEDGSSWMPDALGRQSRKFLGRQRAVLEDTGEDSRFTRSS